MNVREKKNREKYFPETLINQVLSIFSIFPTSDSFEYELENPYKSQQINSKKC